MRAPRSPIYSSRRVSFRSNLERCSTDHRIGHRVSHGLQQHMQFGHDRDAAAYSMRTEEFAYLANTIVAGCSIQARPFTVREASDAVAAICNLGLENWPARWQAEKAGAMSSVLDVVSSRCRNDSARRL